MKRLLLAVICSMISCGAFAHGYHGGMNKPGQQLLMNYIKSRINLVK